MGKPQGLNIENSPRLLIESDTTINSCHFIDDSVCDWYSYLYVRPNYDLRAVQDRRQKNYPIVVFEKYQDAVNYTDTSKIKGSYFAPNKNQSHLWDSPTPNMIWSENINKTTQWPPSKFRFPVLNFYPNGVLKLGITGLMQSNYCLIPEKLVDDLREKYRVNYHTLNIVFVIDGSSGMENVFPKLTNAIIKCKYQFEKDSLFSNFESSYRANINWGAVVYRDSFAEEFAGEVSYLQHDYRDCMNWLDTIYDSRKNVSDKYGCKAVNYGLFMAISDVLAEREDENNLIILVGSAGDHQRGENDWTYVPNETIIDGLSKLRAKIAVIQVNPSEYAYGRHMVKDSCNSLFDHMKSICEKSAQRVYPEYILDLMNNEALLVDNKNDIYNERIYNQNEIVDIDSLSHKIEFVIMNYFNMVNQVSLMSHDLLYTGLPYNEIIKKYTSNEDILSESAAYLLADFYWYLKKRDDYKNRPDLLWNQFECLLQQKGRIYKEGYSTFEANIITDNFWNYELLVTVQERENIIRKLAIFQKIINQSYQLDNRSRRYLYDFFIFMLTEYCDCEDDPALEECKIHVALECYFGLPIPICNQKFDRILNLKIKDLLSPYMCSIGDIKEIYMEFKRSRNTIIQNANFDQSGTREFSNISFWIPLEYFPFLNIESPIK
ncbi:MAG: hypothetical protein EOL95_10020 [Bacteroidia bacterium]|nr:hypothetical protein [Bacteroidia bacterium]